MKQRYSEKKDSESVSQVCPRKLCGARGSEPCHDRSGNERKQWHASRRRIAEAKGRSDG